MYLSHSSHAAFLLRVCRVAGLAALLLVMSGGALSFAVSLHMTQVFERVGSMRTGALQHGPALRALPARGFL